MKRTSQHGASVSAAPMQGPIQAVMNDPLQASTSASLSNNDGLEYHVHHEQTPSCINASINSTGKHSTSNNDFSAHTTMEHFIVVPSADPLQQIEKHQPQRKQRQQHMHHPLSHAADPGHTTKDDRCDDDAREADDDPRFKIRLGGGTVSRGRRHEDSQAADPGRGYDPLANNSKDVDSGDTKDQTGVAPDENTISIHDRFTTPNCAGGKAADAERSPVMTRRSVHRSADLLEPRVPESEGGTHRQAGPSKHLTPAPSSPLSSTQSKHKPPEHLTDMGPLEVERKIDSGVQLTQDPVSASTSAFTSNSTVNGTIVEAPSSQYHLRRPSSSTLVSEDSCPLYTTSKAPSLNMVSDYHGTESRGMAWSGEHPLLVDFATEPEAMSDDDSLGDQFKLPSPSHQRTRSSSLRHKGHSMSLDTHQDPGVQQPSESSFASSSGARHRGRNVSKENDERSWTTHAGKVHGHGRSATEAVGKRVIIHQVAITDTLAGISLFYGIQLSVLKTTNRLWTNDSIHTRKYLYIPFEECTVTRQTGVVVDESNQTVTLPQRSLQQHTRSGSLFTPGSFQPAAASSMANSRLSSYDVGGPIPDSYNSSHVSTANNLSLTEEYAPVAPTISSITAGMLPSTSVTVAPPSAATPSPRVGTWTEPKSLVAPPVPSPAMTTTVLKSDNSLGASSVTPQQTTGAATLLSENLPNTVIVPPSMTHEVLAARFKEMDLVLSEQQQRKALNQEQELRTNPVHHRHKATDLRQYSQHHQQQQTLQPRNSGKSSPSVSNTGSRRASVDVGTHEFLVQGGVDVNGKRESAAGPHDVRQKVNGVYSAIGEEEGCDQYPRQQSENDFVTFGHHRHIYESDERQIDEVPTTLRRQELVTVPTGMLSFFPSPEHSKKLETPQSISRLQTRFDSYGSSSLSSSSSGSFRRMPQDKRVAGTMPSRGRTALSEHTFQAPTSAASDRQRGNQERYSESSASTTDPELETGVSDFARAFYPRTVRVHQQHYSAQNWSLMGESLVQELLGAVRGPLQIARRMYNFTAFGLGSTMGGSGKDADFEPGGLKRRTSTRGTGSTRLRNRQSKDFRNSGPAIELNLTGATKLHADPTVAISSGEATGSVATTSGMSAARESTTTTNGSATDSVDKQTPVVCVVDAVGLDDKSARAARRRSGHGRGSSTGSNHSVRKRSLRSSNPANHAALMALVNELDKDRKGKHKEEDEDKADDKVEETISNHVQGPSPPSPVTDVLARPL